MKTKKATRTLRSVRPNVGIEVNYRERLERLVGAMHDSIMHWVVATYRQNKPEVAQDALPADELKRTIAKLSKRWRGDFNDASKKLAAYFAKSVRNRSEAELRKILKDGGFAVEFRMTPAMKDILASTVNANVSLIKSIPAKYLDDVEGLVMRSVQLGRDQAYLTRELLKRYKITKRRAQLIAKDQNNKATSAFTRARQTELGLNKARWKHSYAGKHPRKSHLAADGKIYDVRKGMKLDGKVTWPGYEINCRCTSETVIEGFT